MKNVVLFVSILILNILTLSAQPPQGGKVRMTVEERSQKITEWMTKELDLTADQIPAVDSINLLFAKTQQVLYQSAEGDRDKIRESMIALEKEKVTALEKVLTPKQMTTYKEKSQEMMNRRGNREN